MNLVACAKIRQGQSGRHNQLSGWPNGQSLSLTEPVKILVADDAASQTELVRLAIDPAAATISASAAGGSRHYFRLAHATLRPLPAEAMLSLASGDAYIAVPPGARRLADSPAMARYLHLHDGFNAEHLADGLLRFLAQEAGQADFPEDVTVLVVEAR